MEQTLTPEQLKAELDKIKHTLLNSSKQLKVAATKVLESSAMDLTPNLIALKAAIVEFDSDVQNFDLNNL